MSGSSRAASPLGVATGRRRIVTTDRPQFIARRGHGIVSVLMQIRPVSATDLQAIAEIDGTVESARYLHLERSGEGLAAAWRLEERPARQKLIEPNRLSDESSFLLKQIATGADEGLALLIEHDDAPVALLLARPDPP